LLLQGLDAQQPWRILDACAAPGGKTGHLLACYTNAQVLALDVDATRCQRIEENLKRLGVQAQARAQVRAADAAQPDQWWDGVAFDAILLDAPCTASGIVRRHPDVRWLRRPGDSAQLAQIQAQLLKALWPLLAPGGRLLYCTCSVFNAEGQGQIETFLMRHTEALLLPSPGHLLPQSGMAAPVFPDNLLREYDGLYYALLEKQPH
jgi:16S rRNA (cytosine967-C5)-methyltransferase